MIREHGVSLQWFSVTWDYSQDIMSTRASFKAQLLYDSKLANTCMNTCTGVGGTRQRPYMSKLKRLSVFYKDTYFHIFPNFFFSEEKSYF